MKLTEAASPYRCVTSSGFGSGILTRRPGLWAVIGWAEKASVGAGCATVPGADQDTVTAYAGVLAGRCRGAGGGSLVAGG